jgi:hypothetical protein
MRTLSISAAALVLTALAASSPAKADYSLIRWQDTGYCEIWDNELHDDWHLATDVWRCAESKERFDAQWHLQLLTRATVIRVDTTATAGARDAPAFS